MPADGQQRDGCHVDAEIVDPVALRILPQRYRSDLLFHSDRFYQLRFQFFRNNASGRQCGLPVRARSFRIGPAGDLLVRVVYLAGVEVRAEYRPGRPFPGFVRADDLFRTVLISNFHLRQQDRFAVAEPGAPYLALVVPAVAEHHADAVVPFFQPVGHVERAVQRIQFVIALSWVEYPGRVYAAAVEKQVAAPEAGEVDHGAYRFRTRLIRVENGAEIGQRTAFLPLGGDPFRLPLVGCGTQRERCGIAPRSRSVGAVPDADAPPVTLARFQVGALRTDVQLLVGKLFAGRPYVGFSILQSLFVGSDFDLPGRLHDAVGFRFDLPTEYGPIDAFRIVQVAAAQFGHFRVASGAFRSAGSVARVQRRQYRQQDSCEKQFEFHSCLLVLSYLVCRMIMPSYGPKGSGAPFSSGLTSPVCGFHPSSDLAPGKFALTVFGAFVSLTMK